MIRPLRLALAVSMSTALMSTISLSAVSLVHAGTPQSNVWRKIGFGHGPGYHAYNGCPPCATANRFPGGMNYYAGQYVPYQTPGPQHGWFGAQAMMQPLPATAGYPVALGDDAYEGSGYEVIHDGPADRATRGTSPTMAKPRGDKPAKEDDREAIDKPAPSKDEPSKKEPATSAPGKLPAGLSPRAPAVQPVPSADAAAEPESPMAPAPEAAGDGDERAALDGLELELPDDPEVGFETFDATEEEAGPSFEPGE